MIIQTNPLCFIGATETREVILPFNQETQLVLTSNYYLAQLVLKATIGIILQVMAGQWE